MAGLHNANGTVQVLAFGQCHHSSMSAEAVSKTRTHTHPHTHRKVRKTRGESHNLCQYRRRRERRDRDRETHWERWICCETLFRWSRMIDGIISPSPLPCCMAHLLSCTPLSSGHYEHAAHTRMQRPNLTLSSSFRQGHSALFPPSSPSVKYHSWRNTGEQVCVCGYVFKSVN